MPPAENAAPRIGAVVVTFFPETSELGNLLDALHDEVDLVVVVDNTDDPAAQLRSIVSLPKSVHLVTPGENIGIAAAQNRGVDWCRREGARWIVEFDQDSTIEPGFVARLRASFEAESGRLNLAAMGPRPVDRDTGETLGDVPADGAPLMVPTTLSSGLLVSMEAIDTVGDKDEGLFIDLVDWEWCFRARSKGFAVMIDPDIVITHRLGLRHTNVMGLSIGTPQAHRHYYAFRNFLLLVRRPYVPVSWKLKYALINLGKLVLYPLFMAEGGARLAAMLAGIRDGVRGRSGRRA